MGMKLLFSFSLGGYPKQSGDEGHLIADISLLHVPVVFALPFLTRKSPFPL
jgi:hypothetical protein